MDVFEELGLGKGGNGGRATKTRRSVIHCADTKPDLRGCEAGGNGALAMISNSDVATEDHIIRPCADSGVRETDVSHFWISKNEILDLINSTHAVVEYGTPNDLPVTRCLGNWTRSCP